MLCLYSQGSSFVTTHHVKYLQGEDQKKLDILANEVFTNMLAKSGQCAALVSTLVKQCVKQPHGNVVADSQCL